MLKKITFITLIPSLMSVSALAKGICESGCVLEIKASRNNVTTSSVELSITAGKRVTQVREMTLPVLVGVDENGNEERHDIVVDALGVDLFLSVNGMLSYNIEFQTKTSPVVVNVDGDSVSVEGVQYRSLSGHQSVGGRGILGKEVDGNVTYEFTYHLRETEEDNADKKLI